MGGEIFYPEIKKNCSAGSKRGVGEQETGWGRADLQERNKEEHLLVQQRYYQGRHHFWNGGKKCDLNPDFYLNFTTFRE